LVSSEKKLISPLLFPIENVWKNPLVAPPGKNPSDAHATGSFALVSVATVFAEVGILISQVAGRVAAWFATSRKLN